MKELVINQEVFFLFLSFCNYSRIETLTPDQGKSNSGDLKCNCGFYCHTNFQLVVTKQRLNL